MGLVRAISGQELGNFSTVQDGLASPDDGGFRIGVVQDVYLQATLAQALVLKAELHLKTHVYDGGIGKLEYL